MRCTLLAVAAVLAAATVAAAHGAPPPRDFETRLMSDDAEDCGGDGQTQANGGCRGAHDLIALNLREAYDAQLGHALVFTLMADLGSPDGQTLTDTLSFNAKGQSKTVTFSTTDDASFSVPGAARVVGPQPALDAQGQPDGTRFTVDAWFKRSDLGLALGDRLSDFSLTAKRGQTTGDIMPGGAYSAVGLEQTGNGGNTRLAFVELRGPIQYLRLTPDASVTVSQGETAFANLKVENRLDDMPQTVSYAVQGTTHVDAGFHVIGSSSSSYPATMDDAVPRGATEDTHLAVTGLALGSGTIEVTLTTDRGGLVTGQVAYEVVSADETGSPSTTSQAPAGEGSPGPGGLLLLGLVGLAAVRRR